MVTATGAAAGTGPPPSPDTCPFRGYDPAWAGQPIRLTGRVNARYGGITLFGPCPNCGHLDGINVFIPTTWATTAAAAAPGGPAIHAAAYAHLAVGEPQVAPPWAEVQWEPPGAGVTSSGPLARYPDITEVISCHCGVDFKHQPPAGRAGCGYWAYLRLRKGMPDGQ